MALVDKIIPILAALHNAIPFSEGGRCQGPGRTLLFDITCKLAHRVLLTTLIELDVNLRPYLTEPIFTTLALPREILAVLGGT